MPSSEFQRLLTQRFPELDLEKVAKIVRLRELIVAENEVQNLTRLLSPQDFLEGHVEDAVALSNLGWAEPHALDIGSGSGSPGLICAILKDSDWVLTDSEAMKAEFIKRAVVELGIKGVQVWGKRAEEVLATERVATVVARAVGPVGRIFAWLEPCSTWNTLILMKSRGWEEEWAGFRQTSKGKRLQITGQQEYSVGTDEKYRILIRLERISR